MENRNAFNMLSPSLLPLVGAMILILAGVGRAQSRPAWSDVGAPRDLSIRLEKLTTPGIAARATRPADFHVPRAGAIAIDADFADWANAEWISVSGEPYHFAGNFEKPLTIEIPEPSASTTAEDPLDRLGITIDQADPDYIDKYLLDDIYDTRAALVTAVTPGSPAARAGLREGDEIRSVNNRSLKWCRELHQALGSAMQRQGARTIPVVVRRSGRDQLGGPEDLSVRFAFLVDDTNLYFAARVTDDRHAQTMPRQDIWKNDSIQIGFDPVLARLDDGYGEDGHEIGFALKDGKPLFYRWWGRRGQDDRIDGLRLAAKRVDTQTLYEAAIPLLSLAPLSPDMWPHCGINVVVNDSDDGINRKANLSLRPKVMTIGKQLDRFADFQFAPSPDRSKISMAWFWDYRLQPSGKFGLKVCLFSPTPTRVRIAVRLEGIKEHKTESTRADVEIPVTSEPTEWMLRMASRSQPAEYRAEWEAFDEKGNALADEGLPIYVRP